MNFVELRSFDNYIPANIIQGRLEAEGVFCYLADANTSTIIPFLSNSIGGIKLMVSDDDVEKAKSLLSEFDSAYTQSLACPQCGSHDIHYIAKSSVNNWISAIFFWLIGNYAIASEQVYHCYHCGFEFEKIPEEPTES